MSKLKHCPHCGTWVATVCLVQRVHRIEQKEVHSYSDGEEWYEDIGQIGEEIELFEKEVVAVRCYECEGDLGDYFETKNNEVRLKRAA